LGRTYNCKEHFANGLLNDGYDLDITKSFYINDDWDISDSSFGERSVVSMYFVFTTLSTVGFGDFYPKSDIERLAGAFVLLSGVAVFSYIMGELLIMINHYLDS
jgi:hypothetical protein